MSTRRRQQPLSSCPSVSHHSLGVVAFFASNQWTLTSAVRSFARPVRGSPACRRNFFARKRQRPSELQNTATAKPISAPPSLSSSGQRSQCSVSRPEFAGFFSSAYEPTFGSFESGRGRTRRRRRIHEALNNPSESGGRNQLIATSRGRGEQCWT